jgi:hypothetical protein
MQFSRTLLLGSAVLAVAACSSDPVSKVVTPDPSAAIRWVNAIPDTVGMDYRVVDYPSNASEPALAFGASSGRWRIIPAGSHHVSAFFTNNTAAGDGVSIVSQVLDDATFNLEANKKYTILHYGFTKAGATPQRKLMLIEDVVPTVPAGQVAVRVINAAAAFGAINVYANLAADTSGTATGTPAFANVAAGTVSPWVNFPVATGSNSYRVIATATNATSTLAKFLAPVGSAAVAATVTTGALDAVPGTQQATSAITVVIFGPRVAYVLHTPAGGTSNVAGSSIGAMATLLDGWPARISP